MDDVFQSLDWIAPGFEIVQSHAPDWKFAPPDTVADGGLHARLLVGRKVAISSMAKSASELNARLSAATVSLAKDGDEVDDGCGANVLDSPLLALHHFLVELCQSPSAPDLSPGDVVTTGTWTDAGPVRVGERWAAKFSTPFSKLSAEFC